MISKIRKSTTMLLILLSLSMTITACSESTPDAGANKTSANSNQAAPAANNVDAISKPQAALEKSPNKPEPASMSKIKTATLKTTMGDIQIELNAEKAPLSVANFIEYADAGHYNGTLFHRVIPGFMIQAGGFAPGMQQKPTNTPIDNEAQNGLSNATYTVAMARTNAPHSATSQFFINVADNSRLDFTSEAGGWGYAVFGKVIAGEEVVNKIAAAETGQVGPFGDVPKEDILIESVILSE